MCVSSLRPDALVAASHHLDPKEFDEFGHTGCTDCCMSDTPSDASQFVVLESERDEQQQQQQPIHGAANSIDARPHVLSALSLLALCFFSICAGPIGAEAIITAGGPAIGLVALVVFPLVFYVPMCFMVTELISALPAAGGHAYWIALAFGPQCGFQAGYWSWVSNCVTCALVSSMAVALFAQNAGGADRSVAEEVCRQGLPLLLALPGFLSLRRVGQIVSLLFVCVLGVFVVITVCGAATAHSWSDLTDVRIATNTNGPPGRLDVDVTSLATNLIWCFHGFHNLSVYATEVHRPAATYRRVMLYAIVIMPLTYLLPMAVAVAARDPTWTLWERNTLGDILLAFGGTSKDVLVGILLVCSVVGLYLTGLTSSAFLAAGMLTKRFGPPGFGSSSSSNAAQTTPHGAILASLPVMLIVVNLECSDMIRIANALGGFCSITLILAAVRLRLTQSALPRPTKLCGDLHPAFMVAALVIPIASLVFATVMAFATVVSGVLTAVFIAIGLVYGQRGSFANFDDTSILS